MNPQTEYEIDTAIEIFGFGDECPASRQAVEEREEIHGDVGCPLCGDPAAAHPPEDSDD